MNIVKTPHPVLTQKAKTVFKVDQKIRKIVSDMKKTLIATKNPRGVGLAAPQIGVSLRIYVTRPRIDDAIRVFINPEITWKSAEVAEIKREKPGKLKDDKKLEGCLSIDNVWGRLKRPTKVKLRYQDIAGNIKEEEFTDFMATIVQHETDHLDGILFTRRVLEQKEKLYRIEVDENGKEKLVELKI